MLQNPKLNKIYSLNIRKANRIRHILNMTRENIEIKENYYNCYGNLDTRGLHFLKESYSIWEKRLEYLKQQMKKNECPSWIEIKNEVRCPRTKFKTIENKRNQ